MKTNLSPDNLGRKLRREALLESPQFSPLLHARIMQQIKVGSAPMLIRSKSGWCIGWAVSTISAAALAIVTGIFWIHGQKPAHTTAKLLNPHPDMLPHISMPEFHLHFPALNEADDGPLTEARYGYIDQDAKSVARYVISQLDVLPTPPGRRG